MDIARMIYKDPHRIDNRTFPLTTIKIFQPRKTKPNLRAYNQILQDQTLLNLTRSNLTLKSTKTQPKIMEIQQPKLIYNNLTHLTDNIYRNKPNPIEFIYTKWNKRDLINLAQTNLFWLKSYIYGHQQYGIAV